MSETRQSTVRQRLLAIIVAGVGSFLAAAVSFGMSVYEAANPPPLPVRQAGDRLDTGHWTVTLHSARIASSRCLTVDWRVSLIQSLTSAPVRSITARYLRETCTRLKFGHVLKHLPAGLTRCLR